MVIITPPHIEQTAWEGQLEPLGEHKSIDIHPQVSLGEPVWWPVEQIGNHHPWSPPKEDYHYMLLRLGCILHLPVQPRTRFQEATLMAHLYPRHGDQMVVAQNLYPQRLTIHSQGTFTVGISPQLELGKISLVRPTELNAEIKYIQNYPVIQSYGRNQSTPYWRFAKHSKSHLFGCQHVYLIVAIPPSVSQIQVSLELTAIMQSRFGPIPVGMTPGDKNKLKWTIN